MRTPTSAQLRRAVFHQRRHLGGVVLALMACSLPGASIASRIVYLAEQNTAFVEELYLVDLSTPGVTTRLNKPLSPLSDGIWRFAISPDGTRVVYSGDQAAPGNSDLYLADLGALGTWTRLGSLAPGHRELFARFSPDGNKVAFTASDESFGNVQLYLVDLADPANATRLNPSLVSDGGVSRTGFDFTADGNRVVYVAAQDQRQFELYVVDLAVPGVSTRLNPPSGSIGDSYEGRFRLTPDGTQVVYSAVEALPGVRELHLVSLSEPEVTITLNSPLQAEGDIFDFTVSPDGQFVAYVADQDIDSVPEVFLVELEAPGVARKINAPVQYGAGPAQFTPDSKSIIYLADQERGPDERDLYLVGIGASAQPERLNASLDANVSFALFTISADGARVAYVPEPMGGFRTDLMLVELASPGTAIKVNGPLPNGALDFLKPVFGPDGDEIAFVAVESVADSIQELFFSRLSEAGVSTRLNERLPAEGIVASRPGSFAFLPADAPAPAPAPSRSSGGGATSLVILFLLLTIGLYRFRHHSWRGSTPAGRIVRTV
jgi:Tol biopolymer transport system component